MTDTRQTILPTVTDGSPSWRRWWDAERLDDPNLMRKVWLVSRLVLFLEWAAMLFTLGDTRYYYENISRMDTNGPQATMVEYPTPVLWFLKLPDIIGMGHRWSYVAAFFVLMFLLDALFSWSLWRMGGRLRGKALAFWCLFVPLVGTTAYLRFDIVTAVLAGWALLLVRSRRPLMGGAMIGIGAAIKLWPALLWPALMGDRADGHRPRNRWTTTAGFWGAGGLLALASLIWAGWDRLVSPLGWQGQRGLQIESVWATIPMLLRVLSPHDFWVAVSDFNAWEISGPTTDAFLSMASLSTAIGILGAVVCYVLWLRRGDQRLVEGTALMLLVVFVMIVTNKTFSPQYIIWVGGPLAAGWAMASDNPPSSETAHSDEHHLAVISEGTLALTLLTQLVYPLGYASLVGHRPGMLLATLVLATRNLLLCWVLFRIVTWVWQFLRPGPARRPQTHRAPLETAATRQD